jgi:DNA adenine methylase
MDGANLVRYPVTARGPPVLIDGFSILLPRVTNARPLTNQTAKGIAVKDFNPKTNPNKPTRPVLRYHGGKWRLAQWIISHFPEHDRYVEPYGGAASVLLQKQPVNHEVYNDLDDELVNLFTVLRTRGNVLINSLRLTPFSRTEFNRAFIRGGSPVEQARKAIFRSMAGYGTAGFNRKTGFSMAAKNRSGGRQHEWDRFPDSLAAVIRRLKTVIIEHKPALDVMQYHDSRQTLHYVDPPYTLSTRDAGTDYKHELDDDDHERLAGVLMRLRGHVVLSGYDSPMYRRLFRGWKKRTIETTCQSLARRTECIWIRPAKGR